MKNKGFTLAEVLIVLSIIGIVAAMTIPTLINKIQKHSDFVAFKKEFSVISDAAARIRADNGGSMADVVGYNNYAELFKPYLKVLKYCKDSSDSENCYIKNTDKVYSLDGSISTISSQNIVQDFPKIV